MHASVIEMNVWGSMARSQGSLHGAAQALLKVTYKPGYSKMGYKGILATHGNNLLSMMVEFRECLTCLTPGESLLGQVEHPTVT